VKVDSSRPTASGATRASFGSATLFVALALLLPMASSATALTVSAIAVSTRQADAGAHADASAMRSEARSGWSARRARPLAMRSCAAPPARPMLLGPTSERRPHSHDLPPPALR